MRAIIIEEERFVEFAEKQKLLTEIKPLHSSTPERLGIPENVWEIAMHEAHRKFHYEFVSWAQSHGARCIRIAT